MKGRQFNPSTSSALTTLGVLLIVGLLVSVVNLMPSEEASPISSSPDAFGVDDDSDFGGDSGAASEEATAQQTGRGRGVTRGGGEDGTLAGGAQEASEGNASGSNGSDGAGAGAGGATGCAPGQNGGSTDVGVTAEEIKLAATVVDDGPGSSFLGPVRISMKAVVNKVNRAGGICGRRINLLLRNDSWDAQRGNGYIQNFVESEKVFALAVVPSSEGLRAADRYIAEQGVPVVGTDGMLIHQYKNPWIWPVATSTVSTMHIMAKNAQERGATRFGIVFDAKYRFGVEGAFAFNEAVKRMTGNDIPGFDPSLKSCEQRFCGIQPGKPSYGSEVQSFNRACYDSGPRCEFIAFLLEPDTAVAWFQEGRPATPTHGFGGAQPLFTRAFAENCKKSCDGMWVWSGYIPAVGTLAAQPKVAEFVNDIRGESSSADVTNQFLEGGYIGMNLMVEALSGVGPNLTRDRLRAVLDSMTFDPGLSQTLQWSPSSHFANRAAHAFQIEYKTSFNGWRQTADFIVDNDYDKDHREG